MPMVRRVVPRPPECRPGASTMSEADPSRWLGVEDARTRTQSGCVAMLDVEERCICRSPYPSRATAPNFAGVGPRPLEPPGGSNRLPLECAPSRMRLERCADSSRAAFGPTSQAVGLLRLCLRGARELNAAGQPRLHTCGDCGEDFGSKTLLARHRVRLPTIQAMPLRGGDGLEDLAEGQTRPLEGHAERHLGINTYTSFRAPFLISGASRAGSMLELSENVLGGMLPESEEEIVTAPREARTTADPGSRHLCSPRNT
jgi:hypothetical protein